MLISALIQAPKTVPNSCESGSNHSRQKCLCETTYKIQDTQIRLVIFPPQSQVPLTPLFCVSLLVLRNFLIESGFPGQSRVIFQFQCHLFSSLNSICQLNSPLPGNLHVQFPGIRRQTFLEEGQNYSALPQLLPLLQENHVVSALTQLF